MKEMCNNKKTTICDFHSISLLLWILYLSSVILKIYKVYTTISEIATSKIKLLQI